jgi:sec-independent protein translocase protein TatA
MFGLGPSELVIVGIVAILLFGKNLPQVAAKLGRTYRDFRRSLSDLQSQMDITGEFSLDEPRARPRPQRTYRDYDDYEDISAPKFEPPPAPPEPGGGSQA